MATKTKNKRRNYIQYFHISEPTLHEKGHTVYKVIRRFTAVDATDQDNEEEEEIVWRRYNDFKKLYKAMFTLHKSLHRKEEFPPFVRAKMFGRFDEAVLEERQRSAQDLLNFVGQRPYLVNSKPFQQFFQGKVCVKVSDPSNVLQPIPVTESRTQELQDKNVAATESDVDSINSSLAEIASQSCDMLANNTTESACASLGGVSIYRQIADKFSLGEMDADENTDFTEDSNLSTPQPKDETISTFDPLFQEEAHVKPNLLYYQLRPFINSFHETPKGMKVANSNEWLLSALSEVTTCPAEIPEYTKGLMAPTEKAEDNNLSSEPKFFIEASSEEEKSDQETKRRTVDYYKRDDRSLSTTLVRSVDKVDWKINAVRSKVDAQTEAHVKGGKGHMTNIPKHITDNLGELFSSGPLSPEVQHTAVKNESRLSPSNRNVSLFNLDMRDKGDYIFQAAKQISLAQQCEASGNHRMAFNYYRNGVGMLLTGVQLDDNSTRREIVRRKTAKYLMKAEELHKRHLENYTETQSTESRWDTGKLAPTRHLDPNVACLQGSPSELGNFKVIGLLGRVMLCVDSATQQTCVIKVLHKFSKPALKQKRNIVPTNCPFMTGLIKFVETETAIYLILQHASGGKLWNYLYKTSGAQPSSPREEAQVDLLDKSAFHYIGKHVTDVEKDHSVKESHQTTVDKSNTLPVQSKAHSKGEENPDFRDVLLNARDKYTPGDFSVNSDSENEVKLDDNDDRVEVLSEISEKSTPGYVGMPVKLKQSTSDNDIFVDCKSEINSTDNSDRTESVTKIINSTDRFVKDIENELIKSDAEFKKLLEGYDIEENNYGKMKQSDPFCANVLPADGRISRQFVAQSDKIMCNNSESDRRLHLSSNGCTYQQDSLHSSGENGEDIFSSTFPTQQIEPNHPCRDEHVKCNEVVFRQISQERSLETDNKPRKRSSKGMSSLFGELELAGDASKSSALRVPEGCVRQWAAEMVVALDHLHSLGFVCRDLNPNNLLLGDRGHIQLTYLSQWQCCENTIKSENVQQFYTAPEVCGVGIYNHSCDWWSLGAILFELLTGKRVVDAFPSGITQHTDISLPEGISTEASSFIQEMLKFNSKERLGSGPSGVEDIKMHPFFEGVKWSKLR